MEEVYGKENSSNQSEDYGEMIDFEQMKKDIEDFRQNQMTPFQKVNHFFISYINDCTYYYINGKKQFDLSDTFEQSSSRDFLLR